MLFTILSTQEKKELAVTWIEVETTQGNMIIQRGHAPTLLIIAPKKPLTICDNNGKQETFETPGGILEVTRNEIMLFLNE